MSTKLVLMLVMNAFMFAFLGLHIATLLLLVLVDTMIVKAIHTRKKERALIQSSKRMLK